MGIFFNIKNIYSIPLTHTQISLHNKVIYGSLTERKKAICMGKIKIKMKENKFKV